MRSARILALSCLALACSPSHLSPRAAASPRDSVVYSKVYAIYDLPVYAGKRFDPSILISLMKSTIDPESWTKTDAAVQVFDQNLSLVVAQTDANHDRVRSRLDSFRRKSQSQD